MTKKKDVKKSKVAPEPKFEGTTRTFRFVNPPGHADKYDQITLRDGDRIPAKVQPILDKEAGIKKQKERVKELEEDLLDDGKKNNSKNKNKKSPGRKPKK